MSIFTLVVHFCGLVVALAEVANKIPTVSTRYQSNDEFMNDHCTTIVVGKEATKDKSTLLTYNADCAECDWRINKVAARDWPASSMRPVYLLSGAYPRQVRDDRGVTWSPDNLEHLPQREEWMTMRGEIIGHIPQVDHTYALIEGLYGIMNEHQVSIGESTCASKLWAAPAGSAGGKALLEASELSQLGLERGKTAREAIQVMGDLAVKYGFYSADWDATTNGPTGPQGEGGEALTVADKEEVWVFHVIPDDTGTSAVWVAQRVPDDHIAVVANSFIIREVIKGSPDFMYSENMWTVAQKMKWWSPEQGNLNFMLTFSPTRYHPSYVWRRVWRVFTIANPESKLPAVTDPYARNYPFSMAVAKNKKFDLDSILVVTRDHYEGTPYSLTEGLAAGPYGDPNRWDVGASGNMTARQAMEGEFGRAISLFRTSQAHVAVGRAHVTDLLALVWLAQYAPDSSTYTPLYVSSRLLPYPWIRGAMHHYDPDSAWWNFAAVGNYAARFYSFAMGEKGLVRRTQRELQKRLQQTVKVLEKQVTDMIGDDHRRLVERRQGQKDSSSVSSGTAVIQAATTKSGDNDNSNSKATSGEGEKAPHRGFELPHESVHDMIIDLITTFTTAQGEAVSFAWRELLPAVMTTYRDGYVMGDVDKAVFTMTRMFYPKSWLDAVGYFKTHENNPGGLLFQPSPYSIDTDADTATSGSTSHRHFFGDDDRGDDDGASAVAPGDGTLIPSSSSSRRPDWSHDLVLAYLFWCAVGSGMICASVGFLVGRFNALLALKREVQEEGKQILVDGGGAGKGKGKIRVFSGQGVSYGSTSIVHESMPPSATPTRVVVINDKGSGNSASSIDQGSKGARAKGSSVVTATTATSTGSAASQGSSSGSGEEMYWCYQQGGWRHRGSHAGATADLDAGATKGVRTYAEHVQPKSYRSYQDSHDNDDNDDNDHDHDYGDAGMGLTSRSPTTAALYDNTDSDHRAPSLHSNNNNNKNNGIHNSVNDAATPPLVTGRAGGVTVPMPTQLTPLHWFSSLSSLRQRTMSPNDDDHNDHHYERIV